jgi:hypothetical protein
LGLFCQGADGIGILQQIQPGLGSRQIAVSDIRRGDHGAVFVFKVAPERCGGSILMIPGDGHPGDRQSEQHTNNETGQQVPAAAFFGHG